MLYDKQYTLYRKIKTGKIRAYSVTPTYENISCDVQPVSLEVEIGMDNIPAFDSFRIYTDNLDIIGEDKLIIDTIEYIVTGTPKKYQGILKNNLIALIKKKYD